MINILIRTHDRPNEFRRCLQSIYSQTYEDYRIIISADNGNTEIYVRPHGHEFIRTYPGEGEKPWNRYQNELQAKVESGIIIYMDDDLTFHSPDSLQLVADNSHEDRLLIFKFLIEGGTGIAPRHDSWGELSCHLNSACFSHSAKHKVKWKPVGGGDHRAIANLEHLKITWLDEIIMQGKQ